MPNIEKPVSYPTPLPTPTSEKQKDVWDKLSVIAALLIPIAVVILGAIFSSSLKSREVEAQYVNLATETLRYSDTTVVGEELRKWALAILKKHSPVPIPPEVEVQIRKLPIERPGWRSGKGFGADDGVVEFKSSPNTYIYVYVDGEPVAETPSTLIIPNGKHEVVFKDKDGNSLAGTSVNVPVSPPIVVSCDTKAKQIAVTTRGKYKGRI